MQGIKAAYWTGIKLGLCGVGFWVMAVGAGAQVTTNDFPQIQAVYGGRVNAVNCIELETATNQTRVFVATESANSIFYGDADHSLAAPYATNNFRFRVVADFDAGANFGTVNGIAGHAASGWLFVVDDAGLLSCDPATAGTRVTNIVGQAAPPAPPGPRFIALLIRDSTLLAVGSPGTSNMLYFGSVSSGGAFTQSTASPILVGAASTVNTLDLLVHPVNRAVYIFDCTGTNGLLKSSAAFDALSGATTFASVSLPAAIATWTGDKRFGIGPDGRLFVAGVSGGTKVVVYSDNDGASWTTVNTGLGGTTGGNVECAGDTNTYHVYFGSVVSTNLGASNSWQGIAQYGTFDTHPNDGVVVADALDPNIVYVTTDQGIGTSTNGGHDLFEIDYGLEAVQIQDLDMNAAKTLAWTASKSGLRRGSGTPMALTWMPNGVFPLSDGSPFYSIAIDRTDPAEQTVYAANCRIYKTVDGGTNWSRVWNIDGNTNGFQNGGYFAAIQASGLTVVAGFYDQNTTKGGLLVSQDGGATWSQPMSSIDINDVLLMTNGTLLAAAAYDSAAGDGGVYNISGTTATRELTNAVGIRNLAADSAGGVYASGQDASYALTVYYRTPGSAPVWQEITTAGLPTPTDLVNGRGPVLTVGKDSATNDLPILAVNVSLYYLLAGETAWQTSAALTYPNGSQINVLYWDELMVGTSAGLFGQNISPVSAQTIFIQAADFDGDGKADPALYVKATGTWYVKLSGSGYSLVTLSFGGTGYTAVARDFDGDGKADPAIYHAASGLWKVKLSASSYAEATMNNFGGSDFEAVAGDYDGDGKADPALYNTTNGNWSVAMSSMGYSQASAPGFGGAGCTAVEQNYDSDHRYDAAIYNTTNGNWSVLLSAANYITANLLGFGGTGWTPVRGDFDGDGLADPAVYNEATETWQVKLSGSGYATATLEHFGGTGLLVAAADYDGDGKADPVALDLATGAWHVLLSASGYAEATLASGWTP